ncbi:MAG: DOMON domain-containing protein [Candidatus Bipolaricaulia bacterium]
MERNSLVLPLVALGIAGLIGFVLFADFYRHWAAEQERRAALRPATLDGQIEPGEYAQSYLDAATGIELQWSVIGEEIFIALRCPGHGWVAMGWGEPDQVQMMKGADFVIAYIDQAGLHIEDSFGVDFVAHAPDTELGGHNDILEQAGSEQGGSTVVEFRRRLDTGDAYDQPIHAGSLTVLFAHAHEDDFVSYHASRSTAILDFFGGQP